MALNYKNEEADRVARELAELTGESITDAVIGSLRERLERESGRVQHYGVREDVALIQQGIAKLLLSTALDRSREGVTGSIFLRSNDGLILEMD